MTNPDQLTQLIQVLEELGALGDRFMLSFEKMAGSLAGIDETYKRQVGRQYPERSGEIRDAIISRVPTQEDRIREEQGASGKPISEWLSEPLEEEEDIGVRERAWIESQKRGAEDAG